MIVIIVIIIRIRFFRSLLYPVTYGGTHQHKHNAARQHAKKVQLSLQTGKENKKLSKIRKMQHHAAYDLSIPYRHGIFSLVGITLCLYLHCGSIIGNNTVGYSHSLGIKRNDISLLYFGTCYTLNVAYTAYGHCGFHASGFNIINVIPYKAGNGNRKTQQNDHYKSYCPYYRTKGGKYFPAFGSGTFFRISSINLHSSI